MLREIAADGGDVANLPRADFRRGLLQAGKGFLQFRVVFEFGDGDLRANGPGFGAGLDFVRAGERL